MILCVVNGCSKRSGLDKDVSFFRIPKVISYNGRREYELTKKRRAGFLAAISREGLRATLISISKDQCIFTTKLIQIGYLRCGRVMKRRSNLARSY